MPGNQTKEEWLQRPDVAGSPDALGTGVVLPRAKEPKKLFANVTYDGILQRDASENFFALAWVPHAVALRSTNQFYTVQRAL